MEARLAPAATSTLPLEIRNEDATEDKGIDIDEAATSTTTQETSGSVDPDSAKAETASSLASPGSSEPEKGSKEDV